MKEALKPYIEIDKKTKKKRTICPTCGNKLEFYKKPYKCPFCKQAIDWSEEE